MHNVHSPAVPSAIPIQEKLHVGSKIDVHGKVKHGHHKDFSVELLSGPHIVLHINFRFQHDHEVVMNSHSGGSWGTEVRHHNPLHHDDQFHLHIEAHQEYFEITVNGQLLAHFPHRFPMESVQALGLKGDVAVERVDFSGFHFGVDWNGEHNYGHAGYTAYGSDNYKPPTFHAAHEYNAYF
ncbi:galactoside-binding lectin [Teladorsagia circumcincta]|uniref:Galectin n=1 Tax=Teladorsagia circumcincta TaxID=45464 RepID=A0A2G9V3S1_TELCI|nr:galactoside-binding lectin [Teladorsagia circumcincta]